MAKYVPVAEKEKAGKETINSVQGDTPQKKQAPLETARYFAVTQQEKQYHWHATLYRRFYPIDAYEQIKIEELNKRANGYQSDFLCLIEPEFKEKYYQPELGYIELPKILWPQYLIDGFQRIVAYHPQFDANGYPRKDKPQGTISYLLDERTH